MLIKFQADEGLASRMQIQYGQRVASKAFAMAAQDALGLASRNLELEDIVTAQKLEIRRLKAVIEQARSAAAQLLEKTGQGDLIDG
ncbi:hypothetical protein [Pseudomonas sp. LRF_L74]|uniref:hypothetical protein n=1 Tax=Pseudomonas sp. LRF_L74 TaxID=3369422 RepID=UPI003F5FBA14